MSKRTFVSNSAAYSKRATCASIEELLGAYERDRQLIAYEIHDGLVQDALGAQMHLEAALETEQIPPGPVREEIQRAL
ncbi:MAG: histidine kinase, partial [Planctomycetota bacterium]